MGAGHSETGCSKRSGTDGRRYRVLPVSVLFFFAPLLCHADNLVSRPVGFLRLSSIPDSALLSSPFHAFAPLSNAVLTWDAASQHYISTSSVSPGQGFWLENAPNQEVFLAGEVVLDETRQTVLYPSLNLVG
jgi:hypothetical protein